MAGNAIVAAEKFRSIEHSTWKMDALSLQFTVHFFFVHMRKNFYEPFMVVGLCATFDSECSLQHEIA